MATSHDELLTAKEVAARLRVSRRTLDRWVKEGEVPAPVKMVGGLRWFAADLGEYLGALRERRAVRGS